MVWTDVQMLNETWDYKMSRYRRRWVQFCIGLRLDLRTDLRTCQTQDKQNWREKLPVEALQSHAKVFHTAVVNLERKVNIQAISSVSWYALQETIHRFYRPDPQLTKTDAAPLKSLGISRLTSTTSPANIFYSFIAPVSKRRKVEVESLCGHWGSASSESMWMTLRSFLCSNLSLFFLATDLQFVAPRQGCVHAYISLSRDPFLQNTLQWPVIVFIFYFKPGCKLSEEGAPLVYF